MKIEKTPFNWPASFKPSMPDIPEKDVFLYPRDKDIIDLLSRHHLMTSRQIRYRLFSPNSRSCTLRLLQLTQKGYLRMYHFKPYNRKHPYRVFSIGPQSVRELKYGLPPTFSPMLAAQILVANQLYLRLWELPGRPEFVLNLKDSTTGYFLYRERRYAFVALRDNNENEIEVRNIIQCWPLQERNLIVIAENQTHIISLARYLKDWIIPVRYTTDSALHTSPLFKAFTQVEKGELYNARAQVFEVQ